MLLAIDTSTSAIGAALHDGTRVLSSVVHEDPRRHAELLAPAIEQALTHAGVSRETLTRVVCGVGPGPFTGLRVGVVTALVLAHSLGLPPPRGVCSLDALAHALVGRHTGPVLVASDARRKEVYWAVYDVGPHGAHRLDGPGVARAADLREEVRSLPVVGRGAELYADSLPHRLPDAPRDVDPAVLAGLAQALLSGEHPDAAVGGGLGLLDPEPLYLRRPDAVAGVPTTAAAR
ncbi:MULTISPECIES: tRNA (adenosine(37)-N6)-threonylcarbamoyltransferase complex dimerization subunit type 1 TsaB [unclassified Ornithinimicrobium]|uniref:tRNA (adenosine(37)-N6)-threonylcarbamoyltransferase complex dimerization subunit type 1 TsaB n=1 Tax=unclassified Ornithinimicrobium TaxID=2615080 RepID=UPI003853163F